MKKRLFIYTTLILFTGLLSFFAVSIYITNRNNLNIAKAAVIETAQIYAGFFNDIVDMDAFVRIGGDTRITIISREGSVLADSNPHNELTIDNYLNRPEIKAAASGSPAIYIRYSSTLNANLIYYALMVNRADSYVFIRASMPVARIDAYLYQSLPLFILILFVLAIICFISVRGMTNRILRPFNYIEQKLRRLSSGEYAKAPTAGSYEEIDKITREIDDIAMVLQNSFDALRSEKNKLDYILSSIGDGLFVVDENTSISLINLAALSIFNTTPDISGKKLNYLTNDKILSSAVEGCAKNSKGALFELVLEGKIYLITVKRLPDTEFTMVVLADITENRENAKRREEFFANASHELKTPLTAIKGFNELADINNKDEGISKYINGITRETARMMSLIADMLNLSELENRQETEPVSLSLAKIISEVKEAVEPAILEKSIIFETSGDAEVTSEPEHIYEIVKNLVENAVKYNINNGKVSVKVKKNKKGLRLIVTDSGIGISPDEQTKIFERFYRVEKSRSTQSGGTGLGLSIVKHICALYGWKLTLKSKLGIGTEVVVDFEQ